MFLKRALINEKYEDARLSRTVRSKSITQQMFNDLHEV